MKNKLITYIVPIFSLLPLNAIQNNLEIKNLFGELDIEGTVVLHSLNKNQTFIYNEDRSLKLFSPASTFKIVNTLVALNEGKINPEGKVFIWDGTQYDNPNWNKDHSLKSAFQFSCVWCYQIIASKVGRDVYQEYLERLNYGTLSIRFDLTRFWLNGDLRISAIDQVNFLQRVLKRDPVFSKKVYDKLEKTMRPLGAQPYNLYSKTGWDGAVGWFVGYVRSDTGVWLFAANMDATSINRLMWRENKTVLQYVMEVVLQEKGIIGQ